MKNPWLDLPTGPEYIAPADLPYINSPEFAKLREWYNFKLFPDPYVGSLETSKVVFLSNNPRVSRSDYLNLQNPRFIEESLKNIRREPDANFFYWLDDLRDLDGRTYWQNLLGSTAANEAIQKEKLLRNMMQIELIGYHSSYYKPWRKTVLPTQEYSFWLVREALRMNKLIVIMRGATKWFGYLPELKTYPRTILIINYLNPTITRGNMERNNPSGAYEKVVAALKA